MDTEFRLLMRKFKTDPIVRSLQRARLAVYKSGYDSMGLQITRDLRDRLDELEYESNRGGSL
jgi:hypothetical protein